MGCCPNRYHKFREIIFVFIWILDHTVDFPPRALLSTQALPISRYLKQMLTVELGVVILFLDKRLLGTLSVYPPTIITKQYTSIPMYIVKHILPKHKYFS